ncbi:hypothetical protein HPB49_016784 [Dermacentor silvarum]|uniref:Uncharacterized protein n=1 Tax=Dermacentor silvarum TaxID=543639 RepID=A0ACB8C4J3_DERSI|nr:hypothetical protein HPB49_016784 [Dermacentor silvarum]
MSHANDGPRDFEPNPAQLSNSNDQTSYGALSAKPTKLRATSSTPHASRRPQAARLRDTNQRGRGRSGEEPRVHSYEALAAPERRLASARMRLLPRAPLAASEAATSDAGAAFDDPYALLYDSGATTADTLANATTPRPQRSENVPRPPKKPDLLVFIRQTSSLRHVNAGADIPPAEVIRPKLSAKEGTPQPVVAPTSPSQSPDDETLHNPDENTPLPFSASRALTAAEADEQYELYTEQEGRRFGLLHVWILCVVIVATLILPVGMIILSYFVTPLAKAIGASTNETNNTESSGVTSLTTTGVWWAGVPAHCHREPRLLDNVQNVSAYNPGIQRQGGYLNIFCLYNNSRFLTGNLYDFLPMNLPVRLCRYVVYWSIGVESGIPLSRVPKFDVSYGLEQLRTTLDRLGTPDVKILVAVGGYPEDNLQLTFLGRHTDALTRFADWMARLTASYRLDGVAIHWKAAEPGCQGTGNEEEALRSIVAELRTTFTLKSLPGLVTVIVPADAGVAYPLVEHVIDLVDYVFIETETLRPSPPLSYDACKDVSGQILDLVQNHQNYSGNEHKFCVAMSVAPWEVEASPPTLVGQKPILLNLSTTSSYGGPPGVGRISAVCANRSPCLLNGPSSCLGIVGDSLARPLLVYLFYNKTGLYDLFSHLSAAVSATDHCALVLDLDFDDYTGLCQSLLPHTFMNRLYWALLNPGSREFFNYLPQC